MDSKDAESKAPPRLLLSIPEAAGALAVSPRTLRGLVYAGRLRSCRVGTRRLIAAADLEDFVRTLREV